ncbi:DUF3618 domain-containing protein [Microcella daejeonensis]|uniref:DUF3618 domain-containing protein n=1 Tax=Microcella daejeonensis TaxID=2994971 RepID=A0A9E8MMV1_9MICO|nr:DUF3618 domain-containing protein [Microcella daejeonensis]WAB82406.1 DUF3618 domain-containing protein [Microcella daejeonensis]WAB84585.1 DUF3618 domain-containing protein [Microcella daejeonensis]
MTDAQNPSSTEKSIDSAVAHAKEAVTDSVEATRAQLEHTLDAIEDRLDVKKRSEELYAKAQRSYDENPVPWIVGATAVAVGLVGLIAWAIFSDD